MGAVCVIKAQEAGCALVNDCSELSGAEKLGVDGHHRAKVQPVGQIVLVQVNRHEGSPPAVPAGDRPAG